MSKHEGSAPPRLWDRLGLDEKDVSVVKARFESSMQPLSIDGPALFDRLAQTGSIKQALGVDVLLLEALYARAFHLLEIEQPLRATDVFGLLCALDSKQADHWLGYGICLQACDEPGMALTAFDHAATLAPHWPAPHLHRLSLFMRQERWEEAREALRRLDDSAMDDADIPLLKAAVPFRTALEMRET
mgnify:CR=1 FL=1